MRSNTVANITPTPQTPAEYTATLTTAKQAYETARTALEQLDTDTRHAQVTLADLDRHFGGTDPRLLHDVFGVPLRALNGSLQYDEPPASHPLRDELEPPARARLAQLDAKRPGLVQAVETARDAVRTAQHAAIRGIDVDALTVLITALETAGHIESVCGPAPRCFEGRRSSKELLHYLTQVRKLVPSA